MGQGHAQGKVYVSCKAGNLPSYPCSLQAVVPGREHPARGNTETPTAIPAVQSAELSLGLQRERDTCDGAELGCFTLVKI